MAVFLSLGSGRAHRGLLATRIKAVLSPGRERTGQAEN